MKKHLHSQLEVDLMIQRAQAIARKHPRVGKPLISDELIRERRAEVRRELKETEPSHQNHRHK